jgi:hypothetical protein
MAGAQLLPSRIEPLDGAVEGAAQLWATPCCRRVLAGEQQVGIVGEVRRTLQHVDLAVAVAEGGWRVRVRRCAAMAERRSTAQTMNQADGIASTSSKIVGVVHSLDPAQGSVARASAETRASNRAFRHQSACGTIHFWMKRIING